jgi:hypothetical protein
MTKNITLKQDTKVAKMKYTKQLYQYFVEHSRIRSLVRNTKIKTRKCQNGFIAKLRSKHPL